MRIVKMVAAFVISVGIALAVAGTASAGNPPMTHDNVVPGMTHD
jgi:hypothetical protein